jgi:hypothetical protein
MRMRARFPAPPRSGLLIAATLTACVGHPLGTTATGTSPAPVPDVFDCVKGQLKSLGYNQTSIDVAEYRITAKKYDETVRRPDVTFRRVVDRLEIQVAPGSAGAITTVEVDANTFAEMTTQRGPTEVQERTSPDAEAAAQTIVQQCGQ